MSAAEDVNDQSYCAALENALTQAASIFGDQAGEVLILALKERYGIKMGQAPCSSIKKITTALIDISGPGADILISRVRSFLQQVWCSYPSQ